jgi:mRNA-degrading endonuclease RelE of RelBE toxin-antitoxin system
MYTHEIKPFLQEILNKLFKKDKIMYERVLKKIEEVINCDDVEHYKNLRFDMKDKKRVHIGHFVLVFKFVKEENKIIFMDFDHHDKIYERASNQSN